MSFITDIWTRIKTAVEGEAASVESTLSTLEQKLLPGFGALVKQLETTVGEQGLAIIENGLGGIAAAYATGGNVGSEISALAPTVVSLASADLKQDATNAVHGVLSLLIATLPTPAATVAVTTAPTV